MRNKEDPRIVIKTDHSETAIVIVVFLVIILLSGEPSLLDVIKARIADGKIPQTTEEVAP